VSLEQAAAATPRRLKLPSHINTGACRTMLTWRCLGMQKVRLQRSYCLNKAARRGEETSALVAEGRPMPEPIMEKKDDETQYIF